jgi:hypothetical protein
MVNIILIIFGVILVHLTCGLICIMVMLNNPKSYTVIDVLLLSVIGPIIILLWILSDVYCWITAKINKLNERRRIKKQS